MEIRPIRVGRISDKKEKSLQRGKAVEGSYFFRIVESNSTIIDDEKGKEKSTIIDDEKGKEKSDNNR